MKRPSLATAATFALALAAGSAVAAAKPKAVDLGAQGMEALTRGADDQAIALFTRVLGAKGIGRDDRELAYLKRGEAYLHKGSRDLAAADFKRALALIPEDTEARNYLQVATTSVEDAWGPMAGLVNRYWIQTDGKPALWVLYQWERKGLILAYSGLDRSGATISGRFQLDPATGRIGGLTVYKDQAAPTEVEVAADGFAEGGEDHGTPIRTVYQQVDAARFQIVTYRLKNGAWKATGKPTMFMQAPEDLVVSLKFAKPPPDPNAPSFLRSLGEAVKQGALAGLSDGLHDGVHDRTQAQVAGKYTQPR